MDKFLYGAISESTDAGGRDTIVDFNTGIDKIDLSLIDANPNVTGNQAFNFWNGSGTMDTSVANVQVSGGFVYLYLPGDATYEGVIAAGGFSTPVSADFIL